MLRRPLGYDVTVMRLRRRSPEQAACGGRVTDAAEERPGNTGSVEGLGHLYKANRAVSHQKKQKEREKETDCDSLTTAPPHKYAKVKLEWRHRCF